jgi:hypothetical protein
MFSRPVRYTRSRLITNALPDAAASQITLVTNWTKAGRQ